MGNWLTIGLVAIAIILGLVAFIVLVNYGRLWIMAAFFNLRKRSNRKIKLRRFSFYYWQMVRVSEH